MPFGVSRVKRGLLPRLEGWQDIFWITQEPCGATNVKVVHPASMDTAKIMIAAFIAFILLPLLLCMVVLQSSSVGSETRNRPSLWAVMVYHGAV